MREIFGPAFPVSASFEVGPRATLQAHVREAGRALVARLQNGASGEADAA